MMIPVSEGRNYYKPEPKFIENTGKWSKPKWHWYDGRIVEKTNPQTGRTYSYAATKCGTRVRDNADSVWATHMPVVRSALCKRCFPNYKPPTTDTTKPEPELPF